jgi:GTP-binding protein
VIVKEIEGEPCEPYEMLTLDVEESHQGASWKPSAIGAANCRTCLPMGAPASVSNTDPGTRPDRLPGRVPQHDRGTGLMSHVFDEYAHSRPISLAAATAS